MQAQIAHAALMGVIVLAVVLAIYRPRREQMVGVIAYYVMWFVTTFAASLIIHRLIF